MPICITCSTPVKNLYTTYSKADDRSLGKGVRLTQCPNCKRFADKYVEHDYIVLFIDLVLIKPQVYRHLLFNRLGRKDDKLDPSIIRLGILLILFDVYITWARIEKYNNTNNDSTTSSSSSFSNAPIITQYLFFLTLNVVATVAQHLTIRGSVQVIRKWQSSRSIQAANNNANNSGNSPTITSTRNSPSKQNPNHSPNPTASTSASVSSPPDDTSMNSSRPNPASMTINPTASSSSISTALLVSSCTKLFPILLVIWPTNTASTTSSTLSAASAINSSSAEPTSFAHRATSYIGWIVLLNNIEALLILLDCGYVIATALAVAGVVVRWVVEGWILGIAGLVRDANASNMSEGSWGDGPMGDVLSVFGLVGTWIGMR